MPRRTDRVMTGNVRRAAARMVRSVDHRLGRLFGPARVLVDVRTPMNLAVLRPVWRQLVRDVRLAVAFTADEPDAVQAALATQGLARSFVSRAAAVRMRCDLAMTADVWNEASLRRCRRRLMFFHGVAGKYDLDDPRRLHAAGLEQYDRVAFINQDRLDRYLSAGALRPEQAVLVGFPKTDDLFNGTWPAAQVRAALGLRPDAETVLYAPTFSPESSLHLAGEAIITTLLESGRNVIVKPHDRSLAPSDRYTAGIDWPGRLARFDVHPRFALTRHGDSGPFLAAADLLVTDHSTVGFEFALLDRPIVVFDAPGLKEAARIDSDKWELLRSMADVVNTPERLSVAVDAALAHPARLRQARRRAQTLFAHAGSATVHALAVVYDLLDVPPPPLLAEAALVPQGASGTHAPLTTHTGGSPF